MIEMLSTIALVGFVGMAAWSDLRTRKIANTLTFSFLAVAFALRSFAGMDGVLDGLAGVGVALGFALPLFLVGALGGGDGKLLMGVGALLGLEQFWVALLATALVGGVMALGEMARKRSLFAAFVGMHAMLAEASMGGGIRTIRTPGSVTIPYGVAIAAGALFGWFA